MTEFDSAVILGVYALLGVIELFFGYPLFRAVATVTGALIGLTFGPEIYARFVGDTPEMFAASIGAFVGAVSFGVLSLFGVWVVALLWGASLGFAIGVAVWPTTPVWPVVLAVLFGGLAAAFQRPTLSLLTSLHGAWVAMAATAALAGILLEPFGIFPLTFEQLTFEAFPWLATVAVAIGLLGAIFQMRRAALKRPRL